MDGEKPTRNTERERSDGDGYKEKKEKTIICDLCMCEALTL